MTGGDGSVVCCTSTETPRYSSIRLYPPRQPLSGLGGPTRGGPARRGAYNAWFHRRSRDEVARRYGASTSRSRRNVPAGVQPIVLRGAGETMFWLPDVNTLAPDDRLLGAPGGSLRLCPESWLYRVQVDRIGLRSLFQPLLELRIERVLVSHGEPVCIKALRHCDTVSRTPTLRSRVRKRLLRETLAHQTGSGTTRAGRQGVAPACC